MVQNTENKKKSPTRRGAATVVRSLICYIDRKGTISRRQATSSALKKKQGAVFPNYCLQDGFVIRMYLSIESSRRRSLAVARTTTYSTHGTAGLQSTDRTVLHAIQNPGQNPDCSFSPWFAHHGHGRAVTRGCHQGRHGTMRPPDPLMPRG